LDGTPIEQNALQRRPYAGRGDWRGRANFSETQLREILQMALQRPQQLALHTVGDAQTDALLALMESLAPATAWRAKRVRIEHGDGIRPDTLARAARLGVVVIQNPTHFPPPPAPSQSLLASLLGAGVPLALGSDGGVDEANPYLNLMLAASYAANPEEALSRTQALTAYTAGGAFAARIEARQGRIAPGMAADIAVLSQDVLTIPAAALPATRSVLTLVDGEIAYEEPGALPKAATP
ncbi:MAG: amidohydrolase family protein, partial [Burkholderiales bacterium]